MSVKLFKRIVIILSAIIIFNLSAIAYIDFISNAPKAAVKTEVLGAVFYEDTEPGVIDVPLVRPPRKAANPGDVVSQNMTLTNTVGFDVYFRANYVIRIEDENDNMIEGFDSNVIVVVNKNWEYRDGYWYYNELVLPGDKIVGPIDSIEYSDNFADHRNYQVYVPLVIEGVEARGRDINEIDYWPETDVRKIDPYREGQPAKWTTTLKIELL